MDRKFEPGTIASILLLSLILISVGVPSVHAIEWSPDTQLTSHTSDDWYPSIAQANDGKIWIVWHSYRTGDVEIFYNMYDWTSWSSDTRLTTSIGLDILPSIMQAADDRIWVAWTSKRTGDYEIYYKIYDGTSWTSDRRLTIDPNVDEFPSIMQAMDGTIWVAWSSTRTGNEEIFYTTSSDNGDTWSPYTQLTTSTKDDWDPSIMQAMDGTIWVVWTRNDDIYYKLFDGEFWSSDERLTTHHDFDWHPSIAQDSNGTIWVVWDSDRSLFQNDIYFNKYDGTSWESDTQLTTDLEEDDMPSIMQAANGAIWVTWTSSRPSNRDIYYKKTLTAPAHDISVKNVMPASTIMYQAYPRDIYVDVRNEGDFTETFTVRAYANETQIGGPQSVTDLAPGASTSLTFTWDTASVPYGFYTISANASAVLGETDLADNSFTDGTVMVTIPGDVNGDRVVNTLDKGSISAHWYPGPPIGPLSYDPVADVNGDGAVNMLDWGIVSAHWGQSW